LDYNKHCLIKQFSYVQAHNEPNPSNSQEPRSLDCIYLRSLSNAQGGHELYDLNTGRVITRRRVTVISMTANVIQRVEQIASSEGMKGLKMTNNSGKILYDSSWIAGVHDNEEDDENHLEYEQENEDINEFTQNTMNKIPLILMN